MRKIFSAVTVSLAMAATAANISCAEAPRMITTEKTAQHKEIFEIPLYVALPQKSTLEKTSTGAVDRQSQITLDASVLYTPLNSLKAEFTEEKLRERGVELKSSSEFIWNGSRATLMKVFKPLSGGKIKGQWILLIDRKDHSWMINGAYDAKSQRGSQEVLSIMRTAWWDLAEVPLSDVVSVSGGIDTSGTPFRLAKVTSGALIYTKDGRLPTKSADGAIFVASRVNNLYVSPEKRAAFAREKCSEAALGNDLKLISENSYERDGTSFFEIVATADSEEEETLVCQTMLFGRAKDFNVMVGIAHAENDANIKYFKRLTEKCISKFHN